MTVVDVVVVAYNSARKLERCLVPLVSAQDIQVTVVDNASEDSSVELATALGAKTIALDWNSGFSHGCNVGWQAGSAEYVLFLNPDAALDADGVRRLAAILDDDPSVGAVAPRIVHESGELSLSLRRFPSLTRTLAQALFLHRLFPQAGWADEIVRDPGAYERAWQPDWASGACLLVRRRLLEELHGFDERFFLYSEDTDLCRRLSACGTGVLYEPGVTALHTGGASAPPGRVLPLMMASRRLYSRKVERRPVAFLHGLAITLLSLTHVVGARNNDRRLGHLRALTRRNPLHSSPAVAARAAARK
jgi:N-acetylglucosaminyl-diphospho-decaprenol L-rhamnosyltransferase